MSMNAQEKALESRARRAARRAGLRAVKSRRRVGSWENQGEFALLDPQTRILVAGWNYDMSAEEVLDYCRD